MHAWINCFHCIEHCWQLLVPLLLVPIYHLLGPLLCPPCFPILYVVLKYLLGHLHNCSDLQVGLTLQCCTQPSGNEGRGQLSMLLFRSFWAQVCGPTILVILNFPMAFYFGAQTLQLQSAFSHTTM
jgi:hypothetical protein